MKSERKNKQKKTKAACSSRLLPRGCQRSSASRIWRGEVGTMPSERPDRDRRVGLADMTALRGRDEGWGGGEDKGGRQDFRLEGKGSHFYMMPLGGPQRGPRSTPFFM